MQGRIAERSECEATFKKNTHGNQQVFRCASIYEPEEDVCGTYFEPSRVCLHPAWFLPLVQAVEELRLLLNCIEQGLSYVTFWTVCMSCAT